MAEGANAIFSYIQLLCNRVDHLCRDFALLWQANYVKKQKNKNNLSFVTSEMSFSISEVRVTIIVIFILCLFT